MSSLLRNHTSEIIALEDHMAEFITMDAYTVATEAMFDNITDNTINQLSMESFRDQWNEGADNMVVSFKHTVTFFSEAFKSIGGMCIKYDNYLRDTLVEYQQKNKSGALKKSARTTMNELWYFFSIGEKTNEELFDLLKKDTAFSEYALKTYSSKIIDNLRTISKSIINSPDKITALKSPGELFDKKYVGGYPFMHATGVEYKNIGGMQIPRETVKTSHSVNKVGGNIIGIWKLLHNATQVDDLSFKENKIELVIKQGQAYLDNVQSYLKMADEATHLIESMMRTVSSSGVDRNVANVIKANAEAMQVFVTAEAKRSVKGAKYCDLLAKRMIYASGSPL